MTRSVCFAVLSILVLTGCSGGDAPLAPDAGPPDAGASMTDAGPPYDAGPITRVPEATARAGRTSCAFERGAMPWQTIGEEFPIGTDIPIDHFILLMQENRSFDHYFGQMAGVEGLPAGASNPRADGTPVAPFHLDTYCTEDTAHGWGASHTQWGGGANDGFVVTNDPAGERAMGYYDESDLPFYYDLYGTFAMSDHHHCSVLGPTWVNRNYFIAGTSFGLTSNDAVPVGLIGPERGHFVINQLLDMAGVDWAIYSETVPYIYGPFPGWSFERPQRRHFKRGSEFLADVDAGDLPPVVWVDPEWDFAGGVDATDEHPHANVQRGQAWVRDRDARDGEPALGPHRDHPHLRRARRLLRSRVTAGGLPAGRPRARRRRALRPPRISRAARRREPVVAAGVRLERGDRPHERHPPARGPLPAARAHGA